jgi:hypothetical protein
MLRGLPYTDADEEYTTRSTFEARAAMSTFSVPPMLVA